MLPLFASYHMSGIMRFVWVLRSMVALRLQVSQWRLWLWWDWNPQPSGHVARNTAWLVSWDHFYKWCDLWMLYSYKQVMADSNHGGTRTHTLGSVGDVNPQPLDHEVCDIIKVHCQTPHVVSMLWQYSDDVVTILSPTCGTIVTSYKTMYLCHLVSYTVTMCYKVPSVCQCSDRSVAYQVPTRCLVARFLHRPHGSGYTQLRMYLI